MAGDFDFDTNPTPARSKPSRPAAKPDPAPEPADEPAAEPPPRPVAKTQKTPRPRPAPAEKAGPAGDFAFDAPAPAPTRPKPKVPPAPRREEPDEEPEPEPLPRPAPKRSPPRAATPPAPAVAGPTSDFSFDTGPAAPPPDDEPPPRSRRGREETDERPSASKSRYGAKAQKEKGPKSPLLYMGLGAGGVAVLAGIVIAVLLTKGKEPEVAKDNKDKGKAVVPVVQTPPEKKKDPEPSADFMTAEVRERVRRSTVYIRCIFEKGGATGSGFVEKTTKYVVTNAHVIGKKVDPKEKNPGALREIQLIFNSGEGKDKEFIMLGDIDRVKYDSDVDLAVVPTIALRSKSGENRFVVPEGLTVPKTNKLTETQKLFVFGFPLGESLGKEITITDTTVSSFRKDDDGKVTRIQVKGGMTNGNSGGPVVDGRGNVVGVAVSKIRGEDINFAIPGEAIHEFFKKFDVN